MSAVPLDYYQWTSILRSVSALTAYHWVYRETLKPWLIADLLILNDTLPRSLASCYGNLVRNLDQIGVAYGRQGASQRHARGVRNRLNTAIWTISSSTASTNSSRNSLRTMPGWARSSPSSI